MSTGLRRLEHGQHSHDGSRQEGELPRQSGSQRAICAKPFIRPGRPSRRRAGADAVPRIRVSEDSRLRSLRRLWPWLAAVLSGALAFICFAPFEQTWVCWIALTPLLAAVWFSGAESKRRWLRDLLLGYVGGRCLFLGSFLVVAHRDRAGAGARRSLHGRLFRDLELDCGAREATPAFRSEVRQDA